jgi:hypothetical protein
MELTETQKKIIDRVAHLLAESPLDDEIKQTIIDGLDTLPEYMIFELQDALEGEREELKRVAFDIELFLKDQDKNWQKLEADQKAVADQIVEKHVKKIEEEVKIQQVRDKINGK